MDIFLRVAWLCIVTKKQLIKKKSKIKTNKNRELPENKQRIINKIRRKSEKPIDRFSKKVYCEYNNSK